MKDLKPTCRIAVVQAAPVLFDKTACTDKAVRLIAECARSGAELIVFPELFIPGYPYGMTFGFTVGARNEDGRKDWQLYCDNSIAVPGPETERLAAAAKAAGAYVSIGVSERDGVTARSITPTSSSARTAHLPPCTASSSQRARSAWSGATPTADISRSWTPRGDRWAASSAGRAICRWRARHCMKRA